MAWPNQVLATSHSVIPPVSWHELAPLWVLPRWWLLLARTSVEAFFVHCLPYCPLPLPAVFGYQVTGPGRTLTALELL